MFGRKNDGFTLAEVLITLAIIGIVASLTIPVVVRNYQERQTVTKVKKFYSDINQAFQMATVNTGRIENYGAKVSKDFFNYFKPYLKVIKECDNNNKTCFYDGYYKTLDGGTWSAKNPNNTIYYRTILGDGSSVWFHFVDGDCKGSSLGRSCCDIGIDINGPKPPNQLGVDTFYFVAQKNGIYPIGLDSVSDTAKLDNMCNKNNNEKRNGYACTAWIIAKGNMDYLRKTISW